MITDTGKDIIAKYLIGQAGAYATSIAIGCGADPINIETSYDIPTSQAKKNLDFETFRSDIISRGYVNENGTTFISFTAQLPTEERYEITEVGVYSSGANPIAGTKDSKVVFKFADSENWEHHTSGSATAVDISQREKDNLSTSQSGIMQVSEPVFKLSATDVMFNDATRISTKERPRFLNKTILMRTDTSKLIESGSEIIPDPTYGTDGANNSHIHLNNLSFNFDENTSDDELRLAFSLMPINSISPSTLTDLKIMIQFISSESELGAEYANMQIHLTSFDPSVNYYVATSKLGDLFQTSNFTWKNVKVAKVFVSANTAGEEPTNDYYVALDALRFENIALANDNPLYGLVAYSVIKNENENNIGVPIVKDANTTNLIEFRFAVDITETV